VRRLGELTEIHVDASTTVSAGAGQRDRSRGGREGHDRGDRADGPGGGHADAGEHIGQFDDQGVEDNAAEQGDEAGHGQLPPRQLRQVVLTATASAASSNVG
jgi:hypothetical protein